MTNSGFVAVFSVEGEEPLALTVRDDEDQEVFQIDDIARTNNCGRVFVAVETPGLYSCTWSSPKSRLDHMVKFNPHVETVYFASCDLPEGDVPPGDSMWTQLARELEEKDRGSLVVHNGDQVYMDAAFKRSSRQDTFAQAVSRFLERYGETWNSHSRALTLCSNLCLLDDHEFRNDYQGVFTQSDMLSSPIIEFQEWHEPFSAAQHHKSDTALPPPHARSAALECYSNLQQGMHARMPPGLSWAKRISSDNGGCLLVCVERTFRQWKIADIMECIAEHDCRSVIVCLSAFPLPRPEGRLVDSYCTVFSSSKFLDVDDAFLFYSRLFSWMDAVRGRCVAVVGGDAHMAYCGRLTKVSSPNIIPVVCASPITNNPSPDRFWLAKAVKGTHFWQTVHGQFSITSSVSKARRCFAKFNLDNICDPHMQLCHRKKPKSLSKYLRALAKMA